MSVGAAAMLAINLPLATVMAAGVTTVTPTENDGPLVNPYCGWGLWAGPRFFDSRQFSLDYNTTGFGDDAPLFSWVLVDWMWADLEPAEGQYDWAELDAVLAYWRARGKQFLVRLWVTTDPGWGGAPGNKACPDWLWASGVAYHEYTGEGAARQRCPAYADPSWEQAYLPRLKRFLSAYRDRYHRPGGGIIMDQVMGFGDWGEWHTMWSHYPWPNDATKRAVLGKAVQAYLDVFAAGRPADQPLRHLSIAQVYDDGCGGETLLDQAIWRQALDVPLARGFALSRHGFIDGLSGWPNDLMARYWKTNPLIAESNWSYEQVKRDANHGTMAQHVDSFAQWHSTYAHMYLRADSYREAMAADRGQFERALAPGGIGYRFVLTSASWESARAPGQTLTLRSEWLNRNQSWCPYPYRLAAYLVDAGGKVAWTGIDQGIDPGSWLAGGDYAVSSDFLLPVDVAPGDYDLRVALVDANGKPAVRLAIAGADDVLRYRLGALHVAPQPTEKP